MSASLVGSEMCIRDSGPPPRPSRGGFRPPDPPDQRLRRTGGDLSHGCQAVSYTHLTLPTICSV
eukprot:6094607-Alexandrium_andersonii.AAC.1